MSLVFPITKEPKPPYDIEQESNLIKSPTESGYELSRPRFTKARDLVTLNWDLVNTETVTLERFYKNSTKSGSLPFSLTVTTPFFSRQWDAIRFSSPPKMKYNGLGTWSVTCSFREL